MTINAYLSFNGNCKDALDFYSKVFSATPQMMTFGEMPPEDDFAVPDEMKNLVMHASMNVCGNELMFSDVMPDMEYICGNNVSVTLCGSDKAQLTAFYNGLADGGTTTMPLEKTFWSELFGMVTDNMGINWQISHTK